MNRRTYLAGIATSVGSIAGCMASGSNDRKGINKSKMLTDVSISTPDASEISVTPTISQKTIDSDQTAEFKLTVTWTGNERQGLTFGNEVPFSYPNYSTDDTGIVLLPADSTIERQRDDSWLPKTDETGNIPANQNLVSASLEPGESVHGSWEVWANPKNPDGIKSGVYKFKNQIGLDSDFSQDKAETISWAIELKIVDSE